MHEHLSLKETQQQWHGTLKSYLIGFISSLVLTGASFLIVAAKLLSGSFLVYTLCSLAITQALFQLFFFLHLGQEPKPRWESVVFYFMVLILFIIVIGTLWIMHDLNERVMPAMTMGTLND